MKDFNAEHISTQETSDFRIDEEIPGDFPELKQRKPSDIQEAANENEKNQIKSNLFKLDTVRSSCQGLIH